MKTTLKTKQIVESVNFSLSTAETDMFMSILDSVIARGDFALSPMGDFLVEIQDNLKKLMGTPVEYIVPSAFLSEEDRLKWEETTSFQPKAPKKKPAKPKKVIPLAPEEVQPEMLERAAQNVAEYFAEDDTSPTPGDGQRIGQVLNILRR